MTRVLAAIAAGLHGLCYQKEPTLKRTTHNRSSTNPDELAYRLSQVYRLLLTLAEQPATDVARLNNQDTGCGLDKDSLAQMDGSSEGRDDVRSN